jgi:hypothetical protein
VRITEWIDSYIEALPPNIRPATDDTKFTAAALAAHRNGWTSRQIATQVANRNYSNAIHPVLIAIKNLEQLGGRTPRTVTHPVGDASGCLVCPPGTRCPDPVTSRNVTRSEWVGERMALIRELMGTIGLTEDERENHMSDLIHEQRGRRDHGRHQEEL